VPQAAHEPGEVVVIGHLLGHERDGLQIGGRQALGGGEHGLRSLSPHRLRQRAHPARRLVGQARAGQRHLELPLPVRRQDHAGQQPGARAVPGTGDHLHQVVQADLDTRLPRPRRHEGALALKPGLTGGPVPLGQGRRELGERERAGHARALPVASGDHGGQPLGHRGGHVQPATGHPRAGGGLEGAGAQQRDLLDVLDQLGPQRHAVRDHERQGTRGVVSGELGAHRGLAASAREGVVDPGGQGFFDPVDEGAAGSVGGHGSLPGVAGASGIWGAGSCKWSRIPARTARLPRRFR
jgi:hypothetical protein